MVAKTEHKNRSGCPVACALDILGDHWTLLIIRNLMFTGAHEYKDMLAAPEQISSNTLTAHLKKLERENIIDSIPHPESRRRKLYYLTPMGKDLIHTMVSLVRWANVHLSEQLTIPEDKKKLIESCPDEFIQMTLARLKEWEEQYLKS